MSSAIDTMLSIASAPLGPTDLSFSPEELGLMGELREELTDMLSRRNGSYAFSRLSTCFPPAVPA